MSNRSEARRAAAAAIALIAAGGAIPPVALATAAPIEPAASAPLYQMRCWQYGRLISDESPVILPPGTAPRVLALDRAGRPIYVIDTATSTCQLRPLEERTEPRFTR